MQAELERRINSLDRRLHSLQAELNDVKASAASEAAAESRQVPKRPAPRSAAARPAPERQSRPERPAGDLSDLLGARALAVAGGVVTLLGIVFFFVLAVNRGWVGPGLRVGLGAFASVLIFAAGVVLRHRFGQLHSALAAVGAGIAGAYATLLAAAGLYGLIPDWAALFVAAGIAAAGVATSLAWSAQVAAGLGLIGAMLVPIPLAFDGGLTRLGTSFVAIVPAATALAGVGRRWHHLLAVATGASAIQILALLVNADEATDWKLVALAVVFWLLYLVSGIATQLREEAEELSPLAGALILGSGAFAVYASTLLFEREGWAILGAAGVYCLATTASLKREHSRELTLLLGAAGLALAAIAGADLLSGSSLTFTWAAEAAALALLARRLREPRFEWAALGYLGLAFAHALAVEAPPSHLFEIEADRLAGLPSVAAAVAASLVLGRMLSGLEWRGAAMWAAAVATLYAASLGLLRLVEVVSPAGAATDFQRGHTVVSAFWGAVGLLALYAGLRRRSHALRLGGFALFGLSLAKIFLYDLPALSSITRALSFLAVGAVLLVGGFFYQRLSSQLGD